MELPYNKRAEMALIGHAINDCTVLSDFRVNKEDFYLETNYRIFEALSKLGNKSNLITIQEATNIDLVYINDCTTLAYSSADYKSFEEVVIQKSLLRKQILLAQEIMNNAYNGVDSTDLFKQSNDFNQYDDGELVMIKDIVIDEVDAIEKYNDGKIDPGLMTRMKGIDLYANGLKKGDLIYIGARPSMGKSALSNQIALNIAAQNKSVAIFSLEMQNAKIVRRMLVNQSRVHLKIIKDRRLDSDSIKRLTNASAKLFEQNIAISDKGSQKVGDILRKAKRHKKLHGLDVLIIDHFHLLKPTISGTTYEKRSYDSQLLKEMAKELNIPVICLCQLSRSLEHRPIGERMPIMSDLKETGSLEQDGDVILFLNRPDYWHKNERDYVNTHDADISVAKNRDGETGNFRMKWYGGTQRFEEC